MSEKITVIIPIYNTEDYLEKCILSVINQTYKNLEIILVNDGSKDESGKICEKYVNIDNRIKYIYQENKGVSAARNEGMKNATGNYISFVDSDDYIEPNMYEIMYDNLKKAKADVSIIASKYIKNNKVIGLNTNKRVTKTTLNNDEALEIFFSPKDFGNGMCDKLVARNLIEQEKFNVDAKAGEESYVVIKVMCNAKKIVYENIPLYNYVQRSNSVTHTNVSKDASEAANFIVEYIKEKNKKVYNIALNHLALNLLSLFNRAYIIGDEKNYNYAFKKLIEINKELEYKKLSKKKACQIKLLCKYNGFYCILLDIFKGVRNVKRSV